MKRMSSCFFFVLFFMAPTVSSLAGETTDFEILCGDVESVIIGVGDTFVDMKHDALRQVVACELDLTSKGGERLEKHCLMHKKHFAVVAGKHLLTQYDYRVRSFPPVITFTCETWPEAREKLMAICPEIIPSDIPQRVLDHKPQD